jgi:GNAT superfamily N-acetyltransferase
VRLHPLKGGVCFRWDEDVDTRSCARWASKKSPLPSKLPLPWHLRSVGSMIMATRKMIGEMHTATASERPELLGPAWERTRDAVREYNRHGDVLTRYWRRLAEERPDFQFHLVGDDDEILALARSIPVRWDGTVGDLPAGIDGAIARGFDEGDANVLCALLISVPHDLQRRGVSTVAVQAMAETARRHGLGALIAPVRPSWKERYPLVPIERYAQWRRPDGQLFDPWMRVHERLGASVLRTEPQSLRITGTVSEWETWTGMSFPESGDYWFPGGLSTVRINRTDNSGRYLEPNVWMHHNLAQS